MMNQKKWVVGAVLAIVLANTGCVSCCSKSYGKAWNSGPDCELSTPCRGQVYVFMIQGLTPTVECGLDTLREKLAACGFAKVGVGDIASAVCIACEIKKLHRCEPEAKFVLVGYDFGGAAAVCLARELNAKGVPIEAIVLLDPLACGEAYGGPTLLINSGTTTSTARYTNRVVVPDANHYKLPSHPTTVAAISELLNDVATRDYQFEGGLLPEWAYPHAPAMRPLPTPQGGSWDFLTDDGSSPPPIGTRIETHSATTTTNATTPGRGSTFAGAVMIPKP
jgi:hypothetical protein